MVVFSSEGLEEFANRIAQHASTDGEFRELLDRNEMDSREDTIKKAILSCEIMIEGEDIAVIAPAVFAPYLVVTAERLAVLIGDELNQTLGYALWKDIGETS